jgi:sulfate adenylyltransferase subunit 1
VLDQTRRHSFISTLLGIKHLVVAVNKMDLVEFSEARFNEIREDYLTFAEQLPGNLDIRFVPLSALEGDNVASQSANMQWPDAAGSPRNRGDPAGGREPAAALPGAVC